MTTGYLEKLKAEMEGRLGCGIEVVEDGGFALSDCRTKRPTRARSPCSTPFRSGKTGLTCFPTNPARRDASPYRGIPPRPSATPIRGGEF